MRDSERLGKLAASGPDGEEVIGKLRYVNRNVDPAKFSIETASYRNVCLVSLGKIGMNNVKI